MNPSYIAREWADRIAGGLSLRVQVEIGDTSDYHFVVVAIGGKTCRVEAILYTRDKSAWWPVTIGDRVIETEKEFRKYLDSQTESVLKQCKDALEHGKAA